jgi:hypothetical protein
MDTSNDGDFDGDEVSEAEEPVGLFDVPRRWSWLDTAYIGISAGVGLFSVLAAFAGNVAAQIRAHEDYRRSAVDFADQVMADIEKL